MKLKMLGERVLVEPLYPPKQSASGLYVHVDEKDVTPTRGKVIAVGPKVEGVSVGDVVRFVKYGGMVTEVDGDKYIIFKQEELLAVEK